MKPYMNLAIGGIVAVSLAGHLPLASSAESISDGSEVSVSPEEGLITTLFRTPSGGKVNVFMPLNMQPGEGEVGGTVERELPKQSTANPQQLAQAESELSGSVTIEPDSGPAQKCEPVQQSFSCKAPNRSFKVTYHPPNAAPCTRIVDCPGQNSPMAKQSECRIPQLAKAGGTMHVSMGSPGGDYTNDGLVVDGQPCRKRAWSREGCVFHVPPLPPGSHTVLVRRGNQVAMGKTFVAQVKISCTPKVLKTGQPCQVVVKVTCPGLQDLPEAYLIIKNHDPSVLNMPDQTIRIK